MTTIFTHSGDEHMDSDAHGSINPKTGINTAWESNFRVVRFLCEEAARRGVKFHISAGDNFKTGRPSQEAILMFVEAHMPLIEAKIPIILLDGNHHVTGVSSDHRTVIHVVADLIRAHGGTAYIASEPTLIRLDTGEHIAALPWLSRNRVLNELDKNDVTPAEGDRIVADYGIRKLTEMAEAADSSQHLIMASHVTVDDLRIDAVASGFTRGSEVELAHLFSEPVLARKKLEALPFEYGALSHIHTPQAMGKIYHYAGAPNRLTFTDMPDVKGGNFVTLGDDKSLTVEKIVTPARVMASIDLDKPGSVDDIAAIEPGTLVQVWLQTGDPEMPREVRKGLLAAGAIIADTRPRPLPKPAVERTVLPEKVDPVTALRAWAELNIPEGLDTDVLVAAAATLDVPA